MSKCYTDHKLDWFKKLPISTLLTSVLLSAGWIIAVMFMLLCWIWNIDVQYIPLIISAIVLMTASYFYDRHLLFKFHVWYLNNIK